MKKVSKKELQNMISEEVNNLLNEMILSEGAQANRERVVRTALKTYFKEYQNRDLSDAEAQKIFQALKHDIPNIHGPLENKPGSEVKIETFYFGTGVARLYAAGELNNAQDIKNMNNILGELFENQKIMEQYDKNLNNKSLSELMSVFEPILQKKHEEQMANAQKQEYTGTTQYRVVKVPNFETAKQYAKYMDSSRGWCITHTKEAYNQYTAGGAGLFYFLLKDGFENVPAQVGENAPLDEYGLSMIAVSVGINGAIETITSRWNHDNCGNIPAENIMAPDDLSKNVLNFNIYNVCKPYTEDELAMKGFVTPDIALRQIKNGENFKDVFDYVFESERSGIYYVYKLKWLLYDASQNKYLSKGVQNIAELKPVHVVIDFNNKNFDNETRIPLHTSEIFQKCDTIRSVVWKYNEGYGFFLDFFGASVKKIENFMFTDGIQQIPDSICNGFESLTSITIPNSVKKIEDSAFSKCKNLVNVKLPEGLEEIGVLSFSFCEKLSEIVIPSTVKKIDNSAFSYCKNLVDVKFLNLKNCEIISSAFNNTPWFENQKNKGVVYVGSTLFKCFTQIEGGVLNIKDGTTAIGDEAASYHNEIRSINFPKDSLTKIGIKAFYGCMHIKSISLPNSITQMEYGVFGNCIDLETIHFSEQMKTIPMSTFNNCYKLREITIPQSVISIKSYAFANCTSLEQITIPQSVKVIENDVFKNCTSLSSITFEGIPSRIVEGAINGCSGLKEIIVPSHDFDYKLNSLKFSEDYSDFEVYYKDDYNTDANNSASEINEVTEKQINLSSFKVKKELNPRVWKDGHLDSRIRMKLLDIADDFIDFLDINWAKPVDIIMTGSLANYNWSDRFSDIDLHIMFDFSSVDKNTELVQDYFNAQKKIWNKEHDTVSVYGFNVEVYVEDVKTSKNVQSGTYSLGKDKWIDKPSYEKMISYKPNKANIKKKIAEYINLMDEIFRLYKIADKANDSHKIEDVYMLCNKMIENISRMRKRGLQDTQNEMCDENIIFKALRRSGYLDKIHQLKNELYDNINSIAGPPVYMKPKEKNK